MVHVGSDGIHIVRMTTGSKRGGSEGGESLKRHTRNVKNQLYFKRIIGMRAAAGLFE